MAAITVVDEFEDLRRTADEVDIDEGTELWARLGLVCRGVAYMVAGALAFQVAWSAGSAASADTEGALHAVADEPLGRGLFVALAVALAGAGIWRLGEAIWACARRAPPPEADDAAPPVGRQGAGVPRARGRHRPPRLR